MYVCRVSVCLPNDGKSDLNKSTSQRLALYVFLILSSESGYEGKRTRRHNETDGEGEKNNERWIKIGFSLSFDSS